MFIPVNPWHFKDLPIPTQVSRILKLPSWLNLVYPRSLSPSKEDATAKQSDTRSMFLSGNSAHTNHSRPQKVRTFRDTASRSEADRQQLSSIPVSIVVLCHCNACRAATGAILPTGIMADMKTVHVSLATTSTVLFSDGAVPSDNLQDYAPATELLNFQNPELQGTYLAFYKSAPGRSRWFCRRCGTSIGFCMDDGMISAECGGPRVSFAQEDSPLRPYNLDSLSLQVLDIWLGTVDRSVPSDRLRGVRIRADTTWLTRGQGRS
jgi:hypothetical protein